MATSTGIPFFSPSIEITSEVNGSLFSSKNLMNSFNPSSDLKTSLTNSPSTLVLLSVKEIVIPLFKKESSLILLAKVS